MNFLEYISGRAKESIKTIVLPEGTDIRIIEAASIASIQGLADIILLGKSDKIKELAGDLDLSKVNIVDPLNDGRYDNYVSMFYEARKFKGITMDEAKEIVTNPLYFGVMMVKNNDACGMVAGAVNSTPDTIRPALQIIKPTPGIKTISTFLIMAVPECEYGKNGVFLFADCGLIENPSEEELADIAIASALSFQTIFKSEPKVAMLSYSTYGSAKSKMTDKIIRAAQIAKEKAPDLLLDGEIQVDAAIIPAISKMKAPGSIIEGNANVLIFPDLNSGNISCKLVQRLAKAELYGPITQGLDKPVNDLSRGCSVDDILGAIAITAVQAHN